MDYKKYKPYKTVGLKDRKWPDRTINKAPIWCSVDLRDGNQALPIPMGIDTKVEFFKLLQDIGYKEIEIGFPSASQTEYDFLRKIIDENIINDDVTVQVLVQAREHLIDKTFESLKGAKKAIVHFYNSTSTQQRDIVFNMNKEQIKKIATDAAKMIIEKAKNYEGTEFFYEYSPESFTGTELDYALEVCNAVIDVIKPTKDKKLIINLPATVERSTPNVYADRIEYFDRYLKDRENIIISLHTHNDRGTGVAATELGLLAGADRVEGTLFGNGERTGNVDNLTLAMNMFSQGVDPKIHITDIKEIIKTYERATGISVHERHPYAGELVFTAFSGSHQDAIRKGFNKGEENDVFWNVPYLPINPADIGRKYEPVIRINSQSGKGGVAFVLEDSFGYKLPKLMHPEVSLPVQKLSDETGKELSKDEIHEVFMKEFININGKYSLNKFKIKYEDEDLTSVSVECSLNVDDEEVVLRGRGNGPVSAFFHSLQGAGFTDFDLMSYDEHAIGTSENAEAICYIRLKRKDGFSRFGVGIDVNTSKAAIKAIVSSMNRIG